VADRESPEFLESFSALSRSLRGVAAQAYAALEVGSTQAKFLRHIGLGGRLSQADLARATATDPTLAGRALETLIERGWVRRKRSQADRRQYVLELSASGQRVRARVEAERARIAARIMAALDDRDRADFERIAAKLHAAFEPAASAGAPRVARAVAARRARP